MKSFSGPWGDWCADGLAPDSAQRKRKVHCCWNGLAIGSSLMRSRAAFFLLSWACGTGIGCSDSSSGGSTGGYDAGCSPSVDARNAAGVAKLKPGAPTACPTTPPSFDDCSWIDASTTGGFDCTAYTKGACKGTFSGAAVSATGGYDVHKDRSVCGYFRFGPLPSGGTCDYDLPCQ